MSTYHDPRTAAKLEDLEAALDLVREQLAALRKPIVYGIDPARPVGELSAMLWQRLGQRRFRYLLTRMQGFDREVRNEARLERRVNGNGNGNGYHSPAVATHNQLEG